ncbi:MAG: hypothetical protein Q8R57_14615 [Bacteroidota bacterium]|nr:hypothetical protein [Bacteroidota bacterium]
MLNLGLIRDLKPRNLKQRLEYNKWVRKINSSEFDSLSKTDEMQWSAVKLLLEHSFKFVPYYRNLLKSIGANPNDFKSWSDFQKLPLLTKEIIRQNPKDFISDLVDPRRLNLMTTGGSTGNPLGFFREPVMDKIERAFMYHQWGRVGYKEGARRVILRGEPVKGGRLFYKHRFDNIWLMSSYHLSVDHIEDYVSELNKIKPKFFHVYPTSFIIFTQLLIQSKLKLNFPIQAILCGSEPILSYQRQLFEETFNTRVFSWLGQAEGAILASECEYSTNYHVWPQHSYVELINENGENVKSKGLTGEIIGTTINNYGSPFIRYKTGDLAVYESDHCPKCKRNFLVLGEIKGRGQDQIFLEDGRRIPLTAITFGLHFEAYKKVSKMQVVQKRPGEITILISTIKNILFDELDEIEISTKMKNAVGGMLEINFVYSDDLMRTKNGKHIYFIQEINDITNA